MSDVRRSDEAQNIDPSDGSHLPNLITVKVRIDGSKKM